MNDHLNYTHNHHNNDHPYAHLLIPGTFVVVQGIPGDGLSNTMDRLPELVLVSEEEQEELELQQEQGQQQEQSEQQTPAAAPTSTTRRSTSATAATATAVLTTAMSSNLVGGLFTRVHVQPQPHHPTTTLSSATIPNTSTNTMAATSSSSSSHRSSFHVPCNLFHMNMNPTSTATAAAAATKSAYASRPLQMVCDENDDENHGGAGTATPVAPVVFSRSEDEDSFLVVSDHDETENDGSLLDPDNSDSNSSNNNSSSSNSNNNNNNNPTFSSAATTTATITTQTQQQEMSRQQQVMFATNTTSAASDNSLSYSRQHQQQQPTAATSRSSANIGARIWIEEDEQEEEHNNSNRDDSNLRSAREQEEDNEEDSFHSRRQDQQQQLQQRALDQWSIDCREHEQWQRREWGESAVVAATQAATFAAATSTTAPTTASASTTRIRHDHPLYCSEADMWWVDATTGRIKIFESLPHPPPKASSSSSSSTTTNKNQVVLGTLAPGTTVVALELVTLNSETWEEPPIQLDEAAPNILIHNNNKKQHVASSSSSSSLEQQQQQQQKEPPHNLHQHLHHPTFPAFDISRPPQYTTVNDKNNTINIDNNTSRRDLIELQQQQHQRCYSQGRSGWVQVLRIRMEQSQQAGGENASASGGEGYVVLSWNGYSYLVPGLAESYVQPSTWVWRVTCTVGAFVREGLDLSTKLLTVVPYGNLLLVDGKTVNAMGLSRLRVSYQDGESGDIVTGWCSEFLNPLSGQRGPILQPLPMLAPALYRVVLSDGAVLRRGVELSSPHIGCATQNTVLSIDARCFSEHPTDNCLQRLRLAGNGGWISLRLNKTEPENLFVVEMERLDESFEPEHPGAFHVRKLLEVRAAQWQSHRLFAQQQQALLSGTPVPSTAGATNALHSHHHLRLRGTSSRLSPDVSSVDSDSQHAASPMNNNSTVTMMYSPSACQKLGGGDSNHHHNPHHSGFSPGGGNNSHNNNNKDDRCLICLCEDRTATIVHGETGHIACCLGCARILKARNDACPVCRLPIDVVIQHFWA